MHSQAVDGGRLYFDRSTGTNLLVRSSDTAESRRTAPRALQIGLLTPCNLSCGFCYRDVSAPSRLTRPFLLDLLTRAAEWGVLEVAFGGGEPLLFEDFPRLLRELHETTPLGLNFTTNGTLLTRSFLDEVGDAVGEIRVSAYTDNGYRDVLKLLRGREFGVNLLVTPHNVGLLEPVVYDCLALGAGNVLLLGYKGADASLHLSPGDLGVLRQTLRRREDWPLLLDICWHPLLDDVPQLFARSDCGAGDDFLVITPDRAVQACSFHHEKVPFETFADLQAIYADLKERRPPADIAGCTRASFVERPQRSGVFLWRARAGNNSSSHTVLGRFATGEAAERAAISLRELALAHVQWLQTHFDFERYDKEKDHVHATPPLLEFAKAHGFEWGEGLMWDGDQDDDRSLSVHVLDNTVVIYHPHAISCGWWNFAEFFAAVGATGVDYPWMKDVTLAIAAKGDGPAIELLEVYAAIIADPGDWEEPPWGMEVDDPRLGPHEDCSTEAEGCTVERTPDGLKLRVVFPGSPFVMAVAVERWLRSEGFRDIVVSIDAPHMEKFEPRPTVAPKTGLFGGGPTECD